LEGLPPIALTERPGHPGGDTPGRPAIGATARVLLSDGRKLIGQVDGGSGHSGRRSPDIHLGLGELAKGQRVPEELKWRDTSGKVRATTLQMEPGWHVVQLGSPKAQVAEYDRASVGAAERRSGNASTPSRSHGFGDFTP